ncbi:hypothetical protein MesoLj113a_70590 [Mesorhizobium sp. 113-1-2]|nr:Transposase and inactivated derivatives-like protein [Mesorhizobium loti]BCG75901.1 hypothetical protein MesoLj113a_70590 [Mesorhizobium sp. 113-1-2]BCG82671.1 hypothetical protein MesoLj113b_62130 [Mesorhizobium sp. 113-3-3]BCG90548.1 hypothetical protein MesoLj113c_66580 [Mesorhizobium sp. 113-3-9]BCG97148.1 hypothetical protein MesoLj131a_60120 [Mesorhizobium sp. 131-2-1]BCH04220.1 hypothetical protein MesoLj131b_62190 [Mesorhizobium sp. 131-2-5]BCH26802.1 hypothetical protein MesoLjLb_
MHRLAFGAQSVVRPGRQRARFQVDALQREPDFGQRDAGKKIKGKKRHILVNTKVS